MEHLPTIHKVPSSIPRTLRKKKKSWVWWYKLVTPAFGKGENQEFKASLSCTGLSQRVFNRNGWEYGTMAELQHTRTHTHTGMHYGSFPFPLDMHCPSSKELLTLVKFNLVLLCALNASDISRDSHTTWDFIWTCLISVDDNIKIWLNFHSLRSSILRKQRLVTSSEGTLLRRSTTCHCLYQP